MVRILPQFPPLTNAQKGFLAEKLATCYFLLRGYRPLRQSGPRQAQTDLLLHKGRLVLLVEVKYRPTLPAARQAMGSQQAQRLARQARLVSKRFPHATIRLDTLAVAPVWPFIRHQSTAASLT